MATDIQLDLVLWHNPETDEYTLAKGGLEPRPQPPWRIAKPIPNPVFRWAEDCDPIDVGRLDRTRCQCPFMACERPATDVGEDGLAYCWNHVPEFLIQVLPRDVENPMNFEPIQKTYGTLPPCAHSRCEGRANHRIDDLPFCGRHGAFGFDFAGWLNYETGGAEALRRGIDPGPPWVRVLDIDPEGGIRHVASREEDDMARRKSDSPEIARAKMVLRVTRRVDGLTLAELRAIHALVGDPDLPKIARYIARVAGDDAQRILDEIVERRERQADIPFDGEVRAGDDAVARGVETKEMDFTPRPASVPVD